MTEQTTAIVPTIIDLYADQRHMTRDDLVVVMMNTIMPRDKNGNALATKADLMGFLQICHRYDLDPWAREVYCIVSRGKVLPYISIDGYAKIVNRQPEFDGCEFDYEQNADGQFLSVTCTMFRKDRSRPVRVTEFMSECFKPDSDAWKRNPARMLRHRAFIQAARLSFPIAGALDEDNEQMIDVTPVAPPAPAAPAVEKPKPAPKAPPAQKAPPASQQTQDDGFRPFAPDDEGKQQQRKDGPDEQPQSGASAEPEGKKPARKAAPKAPPAASNGNTEQAETKPVQPAGSGHKVEEHDKPDVEEFVNELNDRLNEAKDVDQLTQIWADMNPPAVILTAPGGEALLRYAQSIFDKREKKLKEQK